MRRAREERRGVMALKGRRHSGRRSHSLQEIVDSIGSRQEGEGEGGVKVEWWVREGEAAQSRVFCELCARVGRGRNKGGQTIE